MFSKTSSFCSVFDHFSVSVDTGRHFLGYVGRTAFEDYNDFRLVFWVLRVSCHSEQDWADGTYLLEEVSNELQVGIGCTGVTVESRSRPSSRSAVSCLPGMSAVV
jgi:hypothetical protein